MDGRHARTHTHRARLAQPCTDTRGPRTPLAQLSRPLRAHTALARTACICTPARSPAPPRTHRTRCHAVPIPRSRPAWLSAPPGERSGPAERSSLSPGMGVREVSGGDNPAAQPPRAGRGCTEPGREGVTAAAPFRVRRGTDGLRSGCAAVLAGSPEGCAFPTAPRVSSQGGLSCLPRGRGTPRGWRDPAHGASPRSGRCLRGGRRPRAARGGSGTWWPRRLTAPAGPSGDPRCSDPRGQDGVAEQPEMEQPGMEQPRIAAPTPARLSPAAAPRTAQAQRTLLAARSGQAAALQGAPHLECVPRRSLTAPGLASPTSMAAAAAWELCSSKGAIVTPGIPPNPSAASSARTITHSPAEYTASSPNPLAHGPFSLVFRWS